jgi:tagaturonate reductase
MLKPSLIMFISCSLSGIFKGMKVFDRFKNPFIRHNLMSIALNSMSKYETRVLPSLLRYVDINGKLPEKLTFSLAAYIEFYKGYRGNEKIELNDSKDVLELYALLWGECDGSYDGINKVVTGVLGYQKLWKMDLNSIEGLNKTVTDYLFRLENGDFIKALKEILH